MNNVDTLDLQGRYSRPTKNEFKDGVRQLGIKARWNDGAEGGAEGSEGEGGTPLPEGFSGDETFTGITTVEELAEQYKGAKSKTYLDFLGDEAKEDPNITRYKTGEDLYKGFKAQSELVGKKGIIVPGENATESEKAEYYKALGVPESKEGYKYNPIEGLHEEIKLTPEEIGAFSDIALKHKLNGSQAQGLFEDYYGMMSDALKKRDEQRELDRVSAETKLRNEWGQDFVQNSTIAKRLVEKFGGKEALEAFGDLGNNPGVLKFLANLGKTISEDSFTGVGSIDLSTDAVGAKSRIKAIEADPDYLNGESPRHKGLVEEITKLFQIAYSE